MGPTQTEKRKRGRPRLTDEEKRQRKHMREAERQRAEEAALREAGRVLASKPAGSSVQAQELIDAIYATHADTVVRLERALKNCRAGTRAYLSVVTELANEKRKHALALQKLGIVSNDLSMQRRTRYEWHAWTKKDGSIVVADATSPEFASLIYRENLDAEFGDNAFNPEMLPDLPQDRELGENIKSGVRPQSSLEQSMMNDHRSSAYLTALEEGKSQADAVRAGEEAAAEVCCRFRHAREIAKQKECSE